MCTMYILLATLSPNALVAFQNDNGNEGKTPLHYLDHKYDALLIMMRMMVMVRMVLLLMTMTIKVHKIKHKFSNKIQQYRLSNTVTFYFEITDMI